MRDDDLVVGFDIAARVCHAEFARRALARARGPGALEHLDLRDRLAEAHRHALGRKPALEALGRRGQRAEVQDMVVHAHKRHVEPAVERRLDALERDHRRAAHQHAPACRILERRLHPLRIVHRAQHQRLVAALGGEPDRHRVRADADDAFVVGALLPRLGDDAVRSGIEQGHAAAGHDLDVQLRQLLGAPGEALVVGFLAARVIRGEDGAVGRDARIGERVDRPRKAGGAQRDGRVDARRAPADDGDDLIRRALASRGGGRPVQLVAHSDPPPHANTWASHGPYSPDHMPPSWANVLSQSNWLSNSSSQ